MYLGFLLSNIRKDKGPQRFRRGRGKCCGACRLRYDLKSSNLFINANNNKHFALAA